MLDDNQTSPGRPAAGMGGPSRRSDLPQPPATHSSTDDLLPTELDIAALLADAIVDVAEQGAGGQGRPGSPVLDRARRMQMIGVLASGIAHNFNNIISAILGYSELVETQLVRGTKPAQYIGEIRRAAERGRDLVDTILTYGRRQEGRIRPVPVRTLCEEAVSLLRASLPPAVELLLQEIPGDMTIAGDAAQLQQVVLNLCNNAAQAMRTGGFIRIAARRQTLAAPRRTSHGELRPGRYLCLAVADSGEGFDDAVARCLFEPFFTTRAAGTGLGLATVNQIVRAHGGAMHVESRPGAGSRFEAWLPAMVERASGGLADSVPGRGETVLLVGPDAQCLPRDEEMLATLGYEPIGFRHPADAIAACRSASDRFDVVLVCLAARGRCRSGWVRALREAAPRQPFLLATAAAIDDCALADAGIPALLRYPLVGADVAAALKGIRRPAARP